MWAKCSALHWGGKQSKCLLLRSVWPCVSAVWRMVVISSFSTQQNSRLLPNKAPFMSHVSLRRQWRRTRTKQSWSCTLGWYQLICIALRESGTYCFTRRNMPWHSVVGSDTEVKHWKALSILIKWSWMLLHIRNLVHFQVVQKIYTRSCHTLGSDDYK
jgi:hypothetical protein